MSQEENDRVSARMTEDVVSLEKDVLQRVRDLMQKYRTFPTEVRLHVIEAKNQAGEVCDTWVATAEARDFHVIITGRD
jgi:hypothetical protein